jgi:hypothetical protein
LRLDKGHGLGQQSQDSLGDSGIFAETRRSQEDTNALLAFLTNDHSEVQEEGEEDENPENSLILMEEELNRETKLNSKPQSHYQSKL